MFKRRFRLPSPALVISMVTLSLVLGGTAVAATTTKHKDAKADTALIKKLAPSLSVKHAKTANNATNAVNAVNATSAVNATNATNATNASQLGGNPVSYYAHAGHEAVHLVGAAGQPAFENSWTNFGGGWSEARFWKDAFGVVHIQGLIIGGSGTAFTLPAGYRPAENLFATVPATGSTTSLFIFSDGSVEPGTTANIGLDGLSFMAGPFTAAAKPIHPTRLPTR